MLRMLVAALVLANAGYFLWTQGALALFGLGPVSQSEAFRLNQQIRPEAMRLLTDPPSASGPARVATPTPPAAPPDSTAAASAARAARAASNPASAAALPSPALSPPQAPLSPLSSAASATPGAPAGVTPLAASATTVTSIATAAPGECLQAGLFTPAQANILRARLQASLPAGSWTLSPVVEPPRWIIYMGRYADEAMVAKKRNELRARGVRFEAIQNPRLNPGLSLGHFTTKSDADQELAKDAERGVRTARVIQERDEVRGQRLVLPAVTAAEKAQLVALKAQLAGRTLTACP